MNRKKIWLSLLMALYSVIFAAPLLAADKQTETPPATASAAHPFKLGINADNWDGQVYSPTFLKALQDMKIQFIVWHIHPGQLKDPLNGLKPIIEFCQKNNFEYLFNTELVNYAGDTPEFHQGDGTYRWDFTPDDFNAEFDLIYVDPVSQERKKWKGRLKDDPLFLGVVYDEAMLMQSLNHSAINGKQVRPYFADTTGKSYDAAYSAVLAKIKELAAYYAGNNKILAFEMLFPDYAHTAAAGGITLAPKLLKENYNDLITAVYAGAAREYGQKELWTCIDLWAMDTFPGGQLGREGGHTPKELREALEFAYTQGYDRAYIEMSKGLMDASYELSEHGRQVVEFSQTLADGTLPARGDWRTFQPLLVVKRFPSGNIGQESSAFLRAIYTPYGVGQSPLTDETNRDFDLADQCYGGLLNALSGYYDYSKASVTPAAAPLEDLLENIVAACPDYASLYMINSDGSVPYPESTEKPAATPIAGNFGYTWNSNLALVPNGLEDSGRPMDIKLYNPLLGLPPMLVFDDKWDNRTGLQLSKASAIPMIVFGKGLQ